MKVVVCELLKFNMKAIIAKQKICIVSSEKKVFLLSVNGMIIFSRSLNNA